MKKIKMNDSGFTLLETMLCFVILGILLVAASQVIASSTNVYYLSESMSYGMQTSQIVASEVRGELQDAMCLKLAGTENSYYLSYSSNCIEFIDSKGRQVKYAIDESDKTLTEYSFEPYNSDFTLKSEYMGDFNIDDAYMATKKYTSKYIGMGYNVTNISFSPFIIDTNPGNNPKPLQYTPDTYVIMLEITVDNPQFGEYTCTEYIPMYNYEILGDMAETYIHVK